MEKHWIVVGGGFLVVVAAAGAVWFLFPRSIVVSPPFVSGTPLAENTIVASSTPKSVVTNRPVTHLLPLAKGDTVASWDFKGVYTDTPELVMQAKNEIKRLSDSLATATSSAMILSVGIANQYELLGNGKKQYEYLGRAIRADMANGLPWHNLGVLMERLGAYQTARIAYEKSTIVQSQYPLYQYAYLEFLIARMKGETIDIEKAFAAAEKNIGKTQDLNDLRSEWGQP